MPPGKVSFDGSLSDVSCERLSHIQNQMSSLGKITKPSLEDNNDEMKPNKKEKLWNKYQVQAAFIEHLQQFIRKTA